MAMNPMQKKARTSFLLGMFLTLIITGLIIVFLILQLGKIRQEQAQIVYKNVYVASQDITSGGIVMGSTTVKRIESTAVPNNAITGENFGTYITDITTAKIALEPGTILTTEMLNIDGKADTNDVRLQEYNMIILPSELTAGDTVDIRLRLPSGEDYIVLSKKYIEKSNADTVWIKVSEDEILTMSNAIVEAYIMEGSLFYATTYVDAGMQGSTTPTYVVSSSVMNLMDADPNIAATARNALRDRYTELARSQRNNVINSAVSGFEESALPNVQSSVEEEIQKRQNLRQEYVDTLGVN